MMLNKKSDHTFQIDLKLSFSRIIFRLGFYLWVVEFLKLLTHWSKPQFSVQKIFLQFQIVGLKIAF